MRGIFTQKSSFHLITLCFLAVLSLSPAISRAQEAGDVAVLDHHNGKVDFSIITPSGFIGYQIKEDWSLDLTSSQMPFIIAKIYPEAIDIEEQTTLVFMALDNSSSESQSLLEAMLAAGGSNKKQTNSTYNGWDVFEQKRSEMQGIPFHSLKAKRVYGDTTLFVIIGWQIFDNNEAERSQLLSQEFYNFLDHATVSSAPYSHQQGEVIRRPSK